VKTKSCNLIGLKRDSDLDESQNEESIGAKRPCPSRDFNIFKGSRLNGTGRGIVGVFSQLEAQSYNN
ncbi:TRAFinteracting proteinlike, partial [Caligus rogercresseyi]